LLQYFSTTTLPHVTSFQFKDSASLSVLVVQVPVIIIIIITDLAAIHRLLWSSPLAITMCQEISVPQPVASHRKKTEQLSKPNQKKTENKNQGQDGKANTKRKQHTQHAKKKNKKNIEERKKKLRKMKWFCFFW